MTTKSAADNNRDDISKLEAQLAAAKQAQEDKQRRVMEAREAVHLKQAEEVVAHYKEWEQELVEAESKAHAEFEQAVLNGGLGVDEWVKWRAFRKLRTRYRVAMQQAVTRTGGDSSRYPDLTDYSLSYSYTDDLDKLMRDRFEADGNAAFDAWEVPREAAVQAAGDAVKA